MQEVPNTTANSTRSTKGSGIFMEKFKNWAENQEAPCAVTRRKYVPRVEKMLNYFEEKMENFYGNDLQ